MTWAWHKLACCCNATGCSNYIQCCVNGIEAHWAIRSEQNDLSGYIEDGIVEEVHITNLCNGQIGLDWSRYTGNTSIGWAKEPATTLPTISGSLSTTFGCLTGIDISPQHLVCPCGITTPGNFNFQLTIKIRNCLPEPTTYYLEVGAGELCFSVGNGRVNDNRTCCLILGGYSIDGGSIVTAWDDDFWIPINIIDEDNPVEVHLWFRANPNCLSCIDAIDTPVVVADEDYSNSMSSLYPYRFTPQKECWLLGCIRQTTGFEYPFVPEAFSHCEDCKSIAKAAAEVPPIVITKPEIDQRELICDNCLWAEAFVDNPSDPLTNYINYAAAEKDPNCKCGCPSCVDRAITQGPNRCIQPTALTDTFSSDSGSTNICINEIEPTIVWHGTRFIGCPRSGQFFNFSRYLGPNGDVISTDLGNLSTPSGFILSDLTFAPCEVIDIAWNNVVDGDDGFGNPCYLVSMTIKGETWTVRRCPLGLEEPIHDILWKIDKGC